MPRIRDGGWLRSLDRRLDDLEAEGPVGIPWDEVLSRIRWYRRGLDAPGVNEEDTLGLLYDLGCAHLAVDDKETAYKVFVDLYGMDTNYRDVVARLEELGPR